MLADVGDIVVVDDDPSLRRLMTSYLGDQNVPARFGQLTPNRRRARLSWLSLVLAAGWSFFAWYRDNLTDFRNWS
jgi:hypothetical protein